ncbi:MAG: hypothetical protein HQM12_09260 [SAR324 cluster bacterium]|nr:hypothetical protein [SAR324 cluster bacterium]
MKYLFLSVIFIMMLTGCSERDSAETSRLDGLDILTGNWQQTSGYEVDYGCNITHHYEPTGTFDIFNRGNVTDENRGTWEVISGVFHSKMKGTRLEVYLEFRGDNSLNGCNGKISALPGLSGSGFYSFYTLGEDSYFDVYKSATGGSPIAVFKRF